MTIGEHSMEVPLVFPDAENRPHRFVLNDANQTARRVDDAFARQPSTPSSSAAVSGAVAAAAATPARRDNRRYNTPSRGRGSSTTFVDAPLLQGMASASPLGENGDDVLTTSALVETPWILSVSLLTKRATAPSVVQLDIQSEMSTLRQVVKVQAFPENKHLIRLILVDKRGTAVVVLLDTSKPNALQPLERLRVVPLSRLLPDVDYSDDETRPAARLSSNLIAFPSPRRMVVARNPFVISVDLDAPRAAVWSRNATLDGMARQRSSLTSLWNTGMNLIAGSIDSSENLDMNPVVALCVADDDPSLVFTFHDNGALMWWAMRVGNNNNHALEPYQVTDLNLGDIPNAESWNDSDDAIQIKARVYPQMGIFCCALYLQTATSMLQEGGGGAQIKALSGSLALEYDGTMAQQRHVDLVLPEQVQRSNVGLVSMAFSPETTSLMALFCPEESAEAIYLEYIANQQGELAVEPDVSRASENTHLLDHVAAQEKARIESLSFSPYMKGLDEMSLQDALHEIDRRFLQYLFRPWHCRGTGTSLPPSTRVVRKALLKCIPQFFHGSTGGGRFATCDTSAASAAAETLAALHEWRRRDSSHPDAVMFAPLAASKTPKASSPKPMTSPGGVLTARSIYDSLQQEEDQVMEIDEGDDNAGIVVDEEEEETPKEKQPAYKKKQIEDHELRWRQLMLQIHDEERIERRPLCFSLIPTAEDEQDEEVEEDETEHTEESEEDGDKDTVEWEAILIRSSATCLFTSIPPIGDESLTISAVQNHVSKLDQFTVHFVQSILADGKHAARLRNVDNTMNEVVYSGRLASCDESDVSLKHWVSDCSFGFDGRYFDESNKLFEGLMSVSESDLIKALNQVPAGGLPGLCLLSSTPSDETGSSRVEEKRGTQLRLAALSICTRTLESLRLLMLGRCLVLTQLGVTKNVQNAALRFYLQTITLQSGGAKHVPMVEDINLATSVSALRLPGDTSSPPKKRPSFESHSTSIFASRGVRDETCAIDNLLVAFSRRCQNPVPGESLFHGASALARLALANMYGDETAERGRDTLSLPELGLLAPTSEASSFDQPKIALLLHGPFVVLPPPFENPLVAETRQESLAECLLIESKSVQAATAAAMVERAFGLLKVADDLSVGLRRISKLRKRIDENSKYIGELMDFISDVVETSRHHSGSEEFTKLLSALFYTALGGRRWEPALKACLENPSLEERHDHLKRFVRAMVDAGGVAELIKLCNADDQVSEDMVSAGVNLYEIATETLSEAGAGDWYTLSAHNAEGLSDYQGALYALHASRDQWRSAAQALDLRYLNACKARVNASNRTDLDPATAVRLQELILDDLVLSAVGCSNAMKLVKNPDNRFIISGEHSELVMSNQSRLKRHRNVGTEGAEPTEISRRDRIMRNVDIEARGVRAIACRPLFLDETCDASVTNSLQSHNVEMSTDQQIMGELFKCGYFTHGIILGMQLSKEENGAIDLFYDAMTHLLCMYVVPLAVSKRQSERPTMKQLVSTLDATSASRSPPVLIGCPAKESSSGTTTANIQRGAMEVLRQMTSRYTSARIPLATDVAHCFLTDHTLALLPHWLEDFMIYGVDRDISSTPGLFARRTKPGCTHFLGDPGALLNLYTMRGMYIQACELVTKVLAAPGRAEKASSRIPEKGNIDFVPYDKIDLLSNLIAIKMSKGAISEKQMAPVKTARDDMIGALRKHFQLLKTSEVGLRSARAL